MIHLPYRQIPVRVPTSANYRLRGSSRSTLGSGRIHYFPFGGQLRGELLVGGVRLFLLWVRVLFFLFDLSRTHPRTRVEGEGEGEAREALAK